MRLGIHSPLWMQEVPPVREEDERKKSQGCDTRDPTYIGRANETCVRTVSQVRQPPYGKQMKRKFLYWQQTWQALIFLHDRTGSETFWRREVLAETFP